MSDTIKKYKIQELISGTSDTFVTLHPETDTQIVLASVIKKDDSIVFEENTPVQTILESLTARDESSSITESELNELLV